MNNGVTTALGQAVRDLTRVTGREAEGIAGINNGTADGIRAGIHRVEDAQSNPRFQEGMRQYDEIYGPSHRDPVPVRQSAEESLSTIYGDLYRSDGSATAGQHAAELVRAPQAWHRLVRESVGDEWYHRRKENTHGGIWVGDAHILDLGHPVINRDYEHASLIEGAGGVYQRHQRALLIGNGQPASHNGPLHEFGHGADHSLGDASRRPNYREVHEATIRVLDNSEYWVVRAGAEDWREKAPETWAEGFAWFYGERGTRPFLGSEEASDHMWTYFLGLDRWIATRG